MPGRTHAYHVHAGNWKREYRGIYRLSLYPLPERPDLIVWSLWSREKQNEAIQGVYSHETALSLYGLLEVAPSKIYMTVPKKFRRSAETPSVLKLHRADVSPDEVEERVGYRVVRPMRAIVDASEDLAPEIVTEAFEQAWKRGLVTRPEYHRYERLLPPFLR